MTDPKGIELVAVLALFMDVRMSYHGRISSQVLWFCMD